MRSRWSREKKSALPLSLRCGKGASGMQVTVEFLGLLKQKTDTDSATLEAATLAELLSEIEQRFPQLSPSVVRGGELQPGYLASINGREFTRAGTQVFQPEDCVLLLSADAGG